MGSTVGVAGTTGVAAAVDRASAAGGTVAAAGAASLKRIPIGLDALKARPNTVAKPRTAAACPSMPGRFIAKGAVRCDFWMGFIVPIGL